MTSLAVIHVAKKKLGLDDETYRAVLERVTGKSSAKEMSEAERGRVIVELRRLGFSDESPSRKAHKPLEGPFAAKLQALWISGWHLGLIRERDDAALLAFVKRQTGVEHTRFLHYPDDAAKAIEALKAWLARDGVDWSKRSDIPPWTQDDRARIALALVRKAGALGLFTFDLSPQARIEGVAGRRVEIFRRGDWIKVHQHFGERVRKARADLASLAVEAFVEVSGASDEQ